MIYLAISIFAVIVIVAITIRRLPYLRPNRLGMEITSPRPFVIQSTSPLQTVWQRLVTLFQGINFFKNRYMNTSIPISAPFVRQSYAPAVPAMKETELDFSASSLTSPISSRISTTIDEDHLPTTAHPGDFWHDEVVAPSGPLEIPTKGLITRRGEAQKIAHELISQADEAFRKKDYKNAEKYYLQAATKDPDNARLYNRLGVIYLNTKNYKDAVEAFRGALRFDDRIASRHFNLALAYLGKRDFRSAEKGLKEAVRLDPTNEKYRKTLFALQKQPA